MSGTTTRGAMALVCLAALACLTALGCSPIVGLECSDGLTFCDRCVDTSTDEQNCGGCGVTCAPGVECVGGTCGAAGDAGLDGRDSDGGTGDSDGSAGDLDGGTGDSDGGTDDSDAGTGTDGGAGDLDASAGDGGGVVLDPDAGSVDLDGGGDATTPPLCGLGEIPCLGACVDPLGDPSHCGGCGVRCATGEACSAGACAAACESPRASCGGRCLDVTRDPDNCGACGVVCESGICIDSECSDRIAGHVIAIGHDFVTSRRGMNRLAGNAVFLARGSPVRVLAWEGASTAASRRGTDAAIDQVARAIGRGWVRTPTSDPADVPLLLADSDALVIYAQDGADDPALRALGAAWSRALREFTERGGVVLALETVSATSSGTCGILDAAGLLTCGGRTEVTGATVSIVAAADAVALRVPLTYTAERTSVRFDSPDGTVVASDGIGPVVIHRTLVP